MKYIIFMLAILSFTNCSVEQEEKNQDSEHEEELAKSISIDKKLNEIFGEIDSTKILNSIGCAQGYFGHLTSQYVLRIPASINNGYKSTMEYNIGENGLQCELLVFEKDSSHLANICTDIIITNYPKAKRKLKSIEGKIKVFIGNKELLWGSQVNNTYIHIETIKFKDSLNNSRIEFTDKFLWKVIDLGIPG